VLAVAAPLLLVRPGFRAPSCSTGPELLSFFWNGLRVPTLSSSSELLLLLAGLCLFLRGLITAGEVCSGDTLAGATGTSGCLRVCEENSGQGLEGGEISGSNTWLLGMVWRSEELWRAVGEGIGHEMELAPRP
jgi:hypothetical protein